MAEEMIAQAGKETQNQTDSTATQTADVDFKDLYTREVQNAKQQRQKKQDVEARLDTIEQSRDDARKKKLEEDDFDAICQTATIRSQLFPPSFPSKCVSCICHFIR